MDAQTTYSLLYLEINLASVFLVWLIRHKTKGLSKMVAQQNFAMAIDALIVFYLSDTVGELIQTGFLPMDRTTLMAAKTVYFLSTALVCFFWFVYFEHLQDSPFVQNRRRVLLSSALVWVMGLLLLVNLFTGCLFSVDPSGVYHRGPLFLILYPFPYLYVLFTCGRALLRLLQGEGGYAKRRQLLSLSLFPIAPALAGILQFYHPQLPVACVCLSMAALALYVNWLEEMISIDPLTRLNNRKQLTHHHEHWTQNTAEEVPLYLLLIDANRFKSINDTYGHSQGDAALVRIADALRHACRLCPRRANIARYGGDEFVILLSADDFGDITSLQDRIRAELERLNRESGAPYELTVSMGVAQAIRGEEFRDLIARADQELYAEKARLHIGR